MNDRHLLVGDSGDHTLCGDPFCPNGYAFAYERDGDGRWVLTQRIEPAGLGLSWGFGRAIALDGDRAIITRTFGPDCGGVPYLFEYDGEQWVETGLLCPQPGQGGEGAGVSLHGSLALVRANFGSVLVYHERDGEWGVTHQLYNPEGTGDPSGFGASFDLDDDWVVIGAHTERLTAGFGGAVYVYRRLDHGRVELAQKLTAPDILNGPQFGISVAIEGDTLVIGGNFSDRSFISQGAAYVHRLVDGQWTLEQELTHAEPGSRDRFGAGLALEGDTLLIGASSDSTPTSDGSVYLFRRGFDGLWRQTAALIPEFSAFRYGFNMELAGDVAAVGARDSFVAGDNRGSVDIFDLSCFLCGPDLDADGALTIFDFLTFANLFDAGSTQADLDGDGELTIFDFLAFQTAFDAGCE